MKKMKTLLCTITCFLFVSMGLGQVVTVTNPTNTIPNLALNYGSLSAAITALSGITAINGPVVITLNAGNNQTAPAGGYVIQFAATTTVANNITITGSNNTITAFTPQTAGALNDGIFKIIGADYITIQNFIMQENPVNAINTPEGSNNMTEWGVALLRATTTDGAQNNTIQNNTISLNRNYWNSFGIYSNARHAPTTPTTASDATAVGGSNLGNKVYGNNISNVMMGITFIGTATAAFQDAGNDIGGSSATTGNTITNWGGNAQLSSFASNTNQSYCIFMNHQVADNISYNVLNNGTTVGTGVISNFYGIYKHYTDASPTGTFTSTISYNTITMASDFTASTLFCISSQGLLTPLPTATINITNNYLLNSTVAGSSNSFLGIFNEDAPGTLNISNNIIRGVNILGEGSFLGILNNGSVVNSINISYNKIGDAIAGAVTYAVASFSTVHAIFNAGDGFTATVNLNNNSMDGFSLVNMFTIDFILNGGNNAAVNINNNQLGTVTGSLVSFSGVQAHTLRGISNTNSPTVSISIQNNDLRGIVQTVTGTGNHEYIYSNAIVPLTNISNNTFTNLSINTSNEVRLIYKHGSMPSGAASIVSNNSIVGSFSKTAPGSNVIMYYSNPNSASGSTLTISGNNFSNVTTTGSTNFFGIEDLEGFNVASSPNKNISGNTISNVTMGTGSFNGLYIDDGKNVGITSNTISNVSTAGVINAVYLLTKPGTSTLDVSSNTINTLNSTADDVYGIRSFSTSPAVSFNSNSITGLSSGGSGKTVTGIYLAAGQTVNMYDNNINNLTGTGTGTAVVNGIWINNGTAVNVYRNKIHSLLQSGTVSASPAVNGMLFSNGTTVTAYNNFVANLNASNANLADAVRGISVTSSTANTTYNLYYNSIYINATSTGTNFGTSGIYHLTNATATTAALNMIDNIIVNTSTANGTGLTAVYRRSDATLANFAATSNYNLFYAGTASATNLIFHDGINSDQTLAAYQTRVSTRDANSVSQMPVFVSATDLHLVAASNPGLNNLGTPVAGITLDIDNQSRDLVSPDMGADEFGVPTYVWTGATNSNWSLAGNWLPMNVPGGGDNVNIPFVANLPALITPATIKDIDIAAIAHVNIAGQTFTINGAVTGQGGLTGSPSSNLTIGGAAGTLNFTPGGEALNNLTMNAAASATLGTALNVYGTIALTTASLNLNGQNLTLKSTAATTARIANLTGSTLIGAGNVSVERYLPNPQRAWHLISAKAVTGSQTIFDSWQNAGVLAANKGTLITSQLYTGSNGFDATSNNASILTHIQNNGSNVAAWNYNLANTNATALSSNQGYMLFVRGDRNYNAGNAPTRSFTVLSATGTLTQGSVNVTVSSTGSGRTLVGNPYASPIDMETIFTGTANLDQNMYVWDPALAGNNGLGGFRNIVRTAGGVYNHTPVALGTPTTIDPTLRFIHSGQAFLLKATGANANIVFTETVKAASTTTVYNPIVATAGDQQIIANLMTVQQDNKAVLTDGIRVRYNASYSALQTDDIEKMGNFGENLSSYRNGKKLIVEQRPTIVSSDTIFLRMTNTAIKDYRFQIGTLDFVQADVTAYLEDAYKGSKTEIDLSGTINYVDFNITADAASANQDRFSIVFAEAKGPQPQTITTIKAAQQGTAIAVGWKASNQCNMKQYELEKSTDGTNYTNVNTQAAIGINGSNADYTWLDIKPVLGNNFYRIRSVGISGEVKISQFVTVFMGKANAGITVYPNPVINRNIGLLFTDMEKGIYQLRLLNTTGQMVFSRTVNHTGGSATQSVSLDYGIAKGSYQLEITKPDHSKTTKAIIITE